jgi:glutamate racemase
VEIVKSSMPIGVFDSGIGGLTVVKSLLRELPNEQIFYFGDTARCPYGSRPKHEVYTFAQEILDYLYALGVKALVIACNTATAVALKDLRHRYDVPVIGVVEPGARAAVRASASGRVGVIGTEVTIQSGAYERAILQLNPGFQVFSHATPSFVPWVERGIWSGDAVDADVMQALHPLQSMGIDTLILGCTHYPLLSGPIEKAMGTTVRLISSAEETAKEVKHILTERGELNQGAPGPHRFMASGDVRGMAQALREWLDAPKAVLESLEEERYSVEACLHSHQKRAQGV